MILTEKHIIDNNHQFFLECDSLCFKSKNIYNQGLYNVRQFYFENKKYLNYVENYHVSKKQESYSQLPTKVSCQTLKLVDQNFKSFFGLLKTEGCIARIPRYLKKDGRYLIKFPKQSLSLKEFKKTGKLKLSQTNIIINTKITDYNNLKEVRIVPRTDHYIIEIVYEKKEKASSKSDVIASIDVGLNNLATICFNKKDIKPFIINGRVLKSINQYYNKTKSKITSKLERENNVKTSKRLKTLTNKRNYKIDDYMHKASRLLVNQLVLNNTGVLIIGKNVGQKQDTNMGKINNQNFVGVPIFKFLNMVTYKARLEGINVIWQEESYTSKASFLNLDFIPIYKHKSDIKCHFSGYRYKRGLYKIRGKKIFINADVNGSYNILRKAVPNTFADGIEGFGVIPMLMNIST
jgi:IS605 OrfB family transposase